MSSSLSPSSAGFTITPTEVRIAALISLFSQNSIIINSMIIWSDAGFQRSRQRISDQLTYQRISSTQRSHQRISYISAAFCRSCYRSSYLSAFSLHEVRRIFIMMSLIIPVRITTFLSYDYCYYMIVFLLVPGPPLLCPPVKVPLRFLPYPLKPWLPPLYCLRCSLLKCT